MASHVEYGASLKVIMPAFLDTLQIWEGVSLIIIRLDNFLPAFLDTLQIYLK